MLLEEIARAWQSQAKRREERSNQPLALYGAVEGALASGFAAAELQYHLARADIGPTAPLLFAEFFAISRLAKNLIERSDRLADDNDISGRLEFMPELQADCDQPLCRACIRRS
ncbi:MAG: hypothetical protein EOR19_32920 [Mesorhizobium sp.]|nr:MAG: hypothetical protein EOR19_32920 [Mesorhizobium sp.]